MIKEQSKEKKVDGERGRTLRVSTDLIQSESGAPTRIGGGACTHQQHISARTADGERGGGMRVSTDLIEISYPPN